MSTPHTPGPWIAKPTAGHDIHGQSVVYAETGGRGTDVAIIYNGAADADLIAAAPDMRAALEELLSDYETLLRLSNHDRAKLGESGDKEDSSAEKARAALQLAKGDR